MPGKQLSLANRLRRFLDNPRVDVRAWYEPVARQVLGALAGQTLCLIVDCTKVGFNHQVMTVSIAYRKRAIPLAWSVHRGSKGAVAVDKQIALLRYVARLLPRKGQVWIRAIAAFSTCR